jgi:hypothetical protein
MVALCWDRRINITCWCFVIPRGRSSIPKGWYCTACRLVQDDNAIIAYTFVEPKQAQAFLRWQQFEQMHSQRSVHSPKASALIQPQDKVMLRAAERERWESGVEMAPADFAMLLNALDQHGLMGLLSDTSLQKDR